MKVGIKEAIERFFSTPNFNMIYSEAVANAFDAGAKNIEIRIETNSFVETNSLKLTIKDDGAGFTDENFDKFSSLLKTKDKHHKGLGRLIYLHYFQKVRVESVYETNRKREFVFDEKFDGSNFSNEELQNSEKNYTLLTFSHFSNKKLNSYDDIKASSVKEYLLEHFMPSFLVKRENNEDFCIQIVTKTKKGEAGKEFHNENVTITPKDLPQMQNGQVETNLFGEMKVFYSVDESTNSKNKLYTAVCIDGRAIKLDIVKNVKIPPKINGIFLLKSEFFDTKSDEARQKTTLSEGERKEVEKLFMEKISEILNEKFPEISKKNKQIAENLRERYPHLEGYFDKNQICLIDENKALEEAQAKFFDEQKRVLGAEKLGEEEYRISFDHATRTLTEYILYRNIIIEKLQSVTANEKEAKIHDIIVPMQKSFSANSLVGDIYNNNAWILDDKYMSYQYVLSDKNISELISKISEENELKSDDLRPDIAFVFSDDINNSTCPVDVVVVELKRKNLGYLDNTRIVSQLKQRARRLLGLYPNKIQRLWFFGIVEFDDELRLEMREDWNPLYSNGEAFYINRELFPMDKNKKEFGEKQPVFMTLMSFDALFKDAKKRNDIFLKILKESIKQHTEKVR